MANTMNAGALFGATGAGNTVNPKQGTARETVPGGPGTIRGNTPILPGITNVTGMSVPMLVALGVMAWFLFRTF